jgi:hypothetical protein
MGEFRELGGFGSAPEFFGVMISKVVLKPLPDSAVLLFARQS